MRLPLSAAPFMGHRGVGVGAAQGMAPKRQAAPGGVKASRNEFGKILNLAGTAICMIDSDAIAANSEPAWPALPQAAWSDTCAYVATLDANRRLGCVSFWCVPSTTAQKIRLSDGLAVSLRYLGHGCAHAAD